MYKWDSIDNDDDNDDDDGIVVNEDDNISLLIALPSHQNIYLNPLHNFYNPLQGFILQSVGFSLWYWGYEVPYMREYISHYNAGVIDRISFYNILQSVRNFKHKSFRDIQSLVPIAIIEFPDDNLNET